MDPVAAPLQSITASPPAAAADTPPSANLALKALLRRLHYAYPIALLVIFLFAFTVRGVRASSNHNSNPGHDAQPTTGPGGKPLPPSDPNKNAPKPAGKDDVSKTQKRVFEWLSAVAAVTFVANAAVVISHALYARKEGWWCGQHVVVCPVLHPCSRGAIHLTRDGDSGFEKQEGRERDISD